MNKTGTIKLEPNIQYVSVATKCIICNDEIILQEYNNVAHDRVFICDKCKAAIMAMRDFIYPPEEEEK